jgi:hypothetical protein
MAQKIGLHIFRFCKCTSSIKIKVLNLKKNIIRTNRFFIILKKTILKYRNLRNTMIIVINVNI